MSAEHTSELRVGDWHSEQPSSARGGTPHSGRQPQRRHSFDISLWRELRDVSAGELRKHSSVGMSPLCCLKSGHLYSPLPQIELSLHDTE